MIINERFDYSASSLYAGQKFKTEGDSNTYEVVDTMRNKGLIEVTAKNKLGKLVSMNFDSNDKVQLVESVNLKESVINDFYKWYDKLPQSKQNKVDDLADDMDLPMYSDCSDAELSHFMEVAQQTVK